MDKRTYTLDELKTLIKESASEFKAQLGSGVESDNKKNNNAAYADAKKKAKDLDGGVNEAPKRGKAPEKLDGNKTTLDYAFEGDPGKDFKDKVKAQAEGYTSTLEKNNGIEKVGDFSDETYKQFKKAGQEMAKNIENAKKTGLTASKAPEGTFKKDNVYESKKISVLNFKSTTFINESQMISKIPDDYKVEGKRFKVKDAGENEFIVEWTDGEANILSYENKRKLNESMNKFFHLAGYNSKNNCKTSSANSRLIESTEFRNVLDKVRETINSNK